MNPRKYGKEMLLFPGVYLVFFLLLFFSEELSAGVREGIQIAMNLVIPSLFLFMVFANAAVRSPAGAVMARPFRPVARRLLRLPEGEETVVLLSLLGGYPVGAKLIGDQVRAGTLSPREGERMLAYCVNCGPAFLLGGVGASVTGSALFGAELCLSQIAACLTVGFLSSFRMERGRVVRIPVSSRREADTPAALSWPVLLVSSVNDAVRSMAAICGFILVFSSVSPVLRLLFRELSPEAACVIQGLLEVTSGCNGLAQAASLDRPLLAAVFTAFGGICVHLQIAAMLHGSGVRMKRFFAFRPLYVAVSAGVTKLLLLLTPGAADCLALSREQASRAFSVSPASGAFLLLSGIMLLFFREKKGTI